MVVIDPRMPVEVQAPFASQNVLVLEPPLTFPGGGPHNARLKMIGPPSDPPRPSALT
jgi:hypothetical protein